MEENIRKFVELVKENPDLPVKIMVASDEKAEDFAYTSHGIKSVSISDWIETDEQFYMDIDDYVDELICNDDTLSENEIDLSKAIKVILIKTGAC